MQLDMHFYGIYALARAAGIKPDSAYIIAYASQFVDDALDGEVSILANNTPGDTRKYEFHDRGGKPA